MDELAVKQLAGRISFLAWQIAAVLHGDKRSPNRVSFQVFGQEAARYGPAFIDRADEAAGWT